MPRQVDQLPPDATTLARKVATLEREVREMRAARRLTSATIGLLQTAPDGSRVVLNQGSKSLQVYADDGVTLLAELGPTSEGGGGLKTRGNLAADEIPVYASLTYGELRYQPVQDGISDAPATVSYDVIPGSGSDLLLLSGALQASDWQAMVDLSSVAGGGAPYFLVSASRGTGDNVEAGPCNMDVSGVLTAANIAYGLVNITPSAANTPTSATISGLGLKGTNFYAQVSPQTSLPGTAVTGVGVNNVTADGATIWLTRTNTTTTGVFWLVAGV